MSNPRKRDTELQGVLIAPSESAIGCDPTMKYLVLRQLSGVRGDAVRGDLNSHNWLILGLDVGVYVSIWGREVLFIPGNGTVNAIDDMRRLLQTVSFARI